MHLSKFSVNFHQGDASDDLRLHMHDRRGRRSGNRVLAFYARRGRRREAPADEHVLRVPRTAPFTGAFAEGFDLRLFYNTEYVTVCLANAWLFSGKL